jgi:predicted RNA-binding protein with PUA-like domain
MAYWLMKSEPDEYSIDDLERDGSTYWDGIRNYQVRNMIRDDMQIGDEAIFYHSNCKPPAAVGVMRIISDAYPDPTQFDPDDPHFDPRSDAADPRWLLRDVGYVRHLPRAVSLQEMREHPGLEGFQLLRRGNRLSIVPVSEEHWALIMALAAGSGPD